MRTPENSPENSPENGSANDSSFATTRWTVVCAAGRGAEVGSDSAARSALAELCSAYWQPLYAFVCRQGLAPPDAQDRTQAFFSWLLEKKTLESLDRKGGRFRAFLLTCMKNFLHNERDRERARKRGGGVLHFSLDPSAGDQFDPADHRSPEAAYDRQWALCLLDSVHRRLQAEYDQMGRQPWYDAIHPLLTQDDSTPHEQIAKSLETTPGAVKSALHRMRQRFRVLLREEISQTVASVAEIDSEICDLFAALRN